MNRCANHFWPSGSCSRKVISVFLIFHLFNSFFVNEVIQWNLTNLRVGNFASENKITFLFFTYFIKYCLCKDNSLLMPLCVEILVVFIICEFPIRFVVRVGSRFRSTFWFTLWSGIGDCLKSSYTLCSTLYIV